MPASPSISVIVPVYNTEKYLRKCLDSICEQTYRNLEILCVNDGSTDDSASILEEYATKDSRIKIINQPNAGLAAARNTGLQHATGKWITGVDSDDYLEPDAYEYALNAEAEDVDIICFGTNIIWAGAKYNEAYEQSFSIAYTGTHKPTPELISKTHVVFWNKLWRKEFIEKHQCRFPIGLWYEDFFFWRALAPFARNIAYLPDAKINYVRQPDSIMSQSGTANLRTLDHVQIIDRLLAYYVTHPLPWQNGELEAFIFSYKCAQIDVPESYHPQLSSGYMEVAKRNGLSDRHPTALRFLRKTSWFSRLFSRHKPGKSTYGFLGIQLFSIQYKGCEKVSRFLGIKI